MNDLDFIKKKIFLILIFVITFVLFLIYRDPYENIFLLISFTSLILILRPLKELYSKKRIVSVILLFICFYIFCLLFLNAKGYKMNLINTSIKSIDETAILLVYEGESEQYNLSTGLTNIRVEGDLIQKLTTPFTLFKNKNNYKHIGKSNYKSKTIETKARIEEHLSTDNKVYLGYLMDKYYVEEKIFQIVNDGYHRIIIVPIFLSENDKLNSLKKRVENLKLYNLNIHIKYTEPLWDSEKIINSYISKIAGEIDVDELVDTGVVLIGESSNNTNKYINGEKQDLMFRKKIENYLVNNFGLDKGKVRLGWYDNQKPLYIEEVANLLEYGVGSIICIYVKPSVTNIENKTIADGIKRNIEIPEGVNIKIIDGFTYDNNLMYELKKRIEFVSLQKWD